METNRKTPLRDLDPDKVSVALGLRTLELWNTMSCYCALRIAIFPLKKYIHRVFFLLITLFPATLWLGCWLVSTSTQRGFMVPYSRIWGGSFSLENCDIHINSWDICGSGILGQKRGVACVQVAHVGWGCFHTLLTRLPNADCTRRV